MTRGLPAAASNALISSNPTSPSPAPAASGNGPAASGLTSKVASAPATPGSAAVTHIAQTPDRAPRPWAASHAYYQTGPFNAAASHSVGPYVPTGSADATDYSPGSAAAKPNVHIDPAFEQSELLGLDMSGVRLKSLPVGLFAFESLFELRLGGNLLSRLPLQIAALRQLVVLDLSDNQLTTVPRELGRLLGLQELLLYNNQLVTLPAELGYLYQLEVFGLEGNPLHEPLLSLAHSQGPLSVITYLREHVLSINPPPDRIWHSLQDSLQGKPPALMPSLGASVSANNSFTLMTYNILAEKYASTQMYGYVPSWYLSWDVRKQMLLHEVLAYDPDIVCLQEVEAGQFEAYFKPQLRMRGNYDGIFAPKSRARTMNEWDRAFVDGCAIFFKMDRFRLVEQHLIEFNQLALARPLLRKHKDMYNRVMTRDNIALVARLQMLLGPASWTELLVANVHIHWDPSFKDVKLVQTIMLCEELEKLVQAIQAGLGRLPLMAASKTKKIGVIIAGDFNSMPTEGVVRFLANGGIGSRHPDFLAHTYEPYSNEGARHSLSLRSACDVVAAKLGLGVPRPVHDDGPSSSDDEEGAPPPDASAGGSPPLLPFTNLTPVFQGCIDYVFYGIEGPLVVTGALAGLDRDYSRQLVGLPSPHFPSDHISLLVEFRVDEQSAREILGPVASGAAGPAAAGSSALPAGPANTKTPATAGRGASSSSASNPHHQNIKKT